MTGEQIRLVFGHFITFAILTGLCWGFYATPLAKSRAIIGPLPTFIGITIGYIVWCTVFIILPMYLTGRIPDLSSGEVWIGIAWSIGAGMLGAAGAHFLTLCMGAGGKAFPHVPMAIVFGTAVVIAAIAGWYTTRHSVQTSPWIIPAFMLLATAVVWVAYLTPHAHPPGHAGPPADSVPEH